MASSANDDGDSIAAEVWPSSSSVITVKQRANSAEYKQRLLDMLQSFCHAPSTVSSPALPPVPYRSLLAEWNVAMQPKHGLCSEIIATYVFLLMQARPMQWRRLKSAERERIQTLMEGVLPATLRLFMTMIDRMTTTPVSMTSATAETVHVEPVPHESDLRHSLLDWSSKLKHTPELVRNAPFLLHQLKQSAPATNAFSNLCRDIVQDVRFEEESSSSVLAAALLYTYVVTRGITAFLVTNADDQKVRSELLRLARSAETAEQLCGTTLGLIDRLVKQRRQRQTPGVVYLSWFTEPLPCVNIPDIHSLLEKIRTLFQPSSSRHEDVRALWMLFKHVFVLDPVFWGADGTYLTQYMEQRLIDWLTNTPLSLTMTSWLKQDFLPHFILELTFQRNECLTDASKTVHVRDVQRSVCERLQRISQSLDAALDKQLQRKRRPLSQALSLVQFFADLPDPLPSVLEQEE